MIVAHVYWKQITGNCIILTAVYIACDACDWNLPKCVIMWFIGDMEKSELIAFREISSREKNTVFRCVFRVHVQLSKPMDRLYYFDVLLSKRCLMNNVDSDERQTFSSVCLSEQPTTNDLCSHQQPLLCLRQWGARLAGKKLVGFSRWFCIKLEI